MFPTRKRMENFEIFTDLEEPEYSKTVPIMSRIMDENNQVGMLLFYGDTSPVLGLDLNRYQAGGSHGDHQSVFVSKLVLSKIIENSELDINHVLNGIQGSQAQEQFEEAASGEALSFSPSDSKPLMSQNHEAPEWTDLPGNGAPNAVNITTALEAASIDFPVVNMGDVHMDKLPRISVNPDSAGVTVENESPTISVLWDQAIQAAVIEEATGPTIASRAYAILHTAIFEAWAAHDPTAIGTAFLDSMQVDHEFITVENKMESMSYAAYVVALDLFPDQKEIFDKLMGELEYSIELDGASSHAALLGIEAGGAILAARVDDGSNQKNAYADTTGYTPVNTDPNNVVEVDSWTPTFVPIDSDDPDTLQQFLTPQWGGVTSFALAEGGELRPVAPEPFFQSYLDASIDMETKTVTLHGLSNMATKQDLQTLKKQLFDLYKGSDMFGGVKDFLKAAKTEFKKGESADIDLTLDVSKALIGPIVNPAFVAQAEDIVEVSSGLTEEQQVIAEFWEDGGGTSFPPGTWMTFGQFVSARDDNSLGDDAKMFFALANAVMDAGIATWEAKEFYDYARPVSAIRDLGHLGLIGEFNDDLDGHVITAYAGEALGVAEILATEFTTYQNPNADPSPPFAEYVSGHSSFSAAGAAVLELFTGSPDFRASVEIDFFLFQEDSLGSTITLQWETFDEAADEAGLSRIYGGIHFEDGDLNGRLLGEEIGVEVYEMAQTYIVGTADDYLGF